MISVLVAAAAFLCCAPRDHLGYDEWFQASTLYEFDVVNDTHYDFLRVVVVSLMDGVSPDTLCENKTIIVQKKDRATVVIPAAGGSFSSPFILFAEPCQKSGARGNCRIEDTSVFMGWMTWATFFEEGTIGKIILTDSDFHKLRDLGDITRLTRERFGIHRDAHDSSSEGSSHTVKKRLPPEHSDTPTGSKPGAGNELGKKH